MAPSLRGGFQAEGESGQSIELIATKAAAGSVVQLRIDDEVWQGDEEKPRSASEWFAF